MRTPRTLEAVLRSPSPQSLWDLRGDLLIQGVRPGENVWKILDQFHEFLCELLAKITARQYSQYAALLDISAVTGVLLERLCETESSDELARELLGTLMSEGLMALGSRQHVKAWEQEMDLTFRKAGWVLYEEIWYLSERAKPDLEAEVRKKLVDQLLAPVGSREANGFLKGVLVGRLFQILLVWWIRQGVDTVG